MSIGNKFAVTAIGNKPLGGGGGGEGSALEIEDEGVSIDTDVVKINFTGAGVEATQTAAGEVDVAISGESNSGSVEHTESETILAADIGKIHVFNSAATIDLQLPDGTSGMEGITTWFFKKGVGDTNVDMDASDFCSAGAAGGSISNTEAGEVNEAIFGIILLSASTGQWAFVHGFGTNVVT